MQVIVPGEEVRSEMDFHRILAGQLEFGEYYGWNLAALRDRLLLDVPRPVQLVWKNSEISREQMGSDLFDSICEVLAEAQEQDKQFGWEDRFVFTLQ